LSLRHPPKAGIAFDLAVAVVGAVVPAFAVEVTRKINGKSDDLTFVG